MTAPMTAPGIEVLEVVSAKVNGVLRDVYRLSLERVLTAGTAADLLGMSSFNEYHLRYEPGGNTEVKAGADGRFRASLFMVHEAYEDELDSE